MPQPKKARGFRKLEVPMVGRERELTELENALTATVQGSGQIACLIGEAGVGKSRLVEELKCIALSHCGGALLWLEGRRLEKAVEAGYWPFRDMRVSFSACSLSKTITPAAVASLRRSKNWFTKTG